MKVSYLYKGQGAQPVYKYDTFIYINKASINN